MNIVTIHASSISQSLAKKYYLVPDTHVGEATWYKIVVMEHLTPGIIDAFMNELHTESLIKA